MTINIQKASQVNVTGHHNNGNCKAIYNITTGEIYASGLDAAKILDTDHSCISNAITGKSKTCKGMRLCLVSKIMDNLEEITEQNRIRIEKVAAYDKIITEQNAKRIAKENIAKHQANIEELRLKLENEERLMQEAQALCES